MCQIFCTLRHQLKLCSFGIYCQFFPSNTVTMRGIADIYFTRWFTVSPNISACTPQILNWGPLSRGLCVTIVGVWAANGPFSCLSCCSHVFSTAVLLLPHRNFVHSFKGWALKSHKFFLTSSIKPQCLGSNLNLIFRFYEPHHNRVIGTLNDGACQMGCSTVISIRHFARNPVEHPCWVRWKGKCV